LVEIKGIAASKSKCDGGGTFGFVGLPVIEYW
jgi:hypothetical protein